MNHLVFVFGTLKEGFPNFATNRGTRLPGVFRTCTPYPLYLVGERHSPWMLDQPGAGRHVAGQVFRIDGETLAAMDRLERITELDGYRRKLLQFAQEGSDALLSAFVYVKPPEQLAASEIRIGPLDEYTQEHAALYRPRTE